MRAVQQLARERHDELLDEYRATKYTFRIEWADDVRRWRATCDQLHGVYHLDTTPEEAIRGVITVVGEIVKNNQEWFWSPEWQAGEREVDEAVERNEIEVFDSGEEFLHHLDQVAAEADQRPRLAGTTPAARREAAKLVAALDRQEGKPTDPYITAVAAGGRMSTAPKDNPEHLDQVAAAADREGTDTNIHRTVPTNATVDWVKSDSFASGTSTIYLVALPVHLDPGSDVQIQPDLGYFLDPHEAAIEARKRLEFQVKNAPVEHRMNFAVSGAAVIPVSPNGYPSGLPLKPWSVRLARKGTDATGPRGAAEELAELLVEFAALNDAVEAAQRKAHIVARHLRNDGDEWATSSSMSVPELLAASRSCVESAERALAEAESHLFGARRHALKLQAGDRQ